MRSLLSDGPDLYGAIQQTKVETEKEIGLFLLSSAEELRPDQRLIVRNLAYLILSKQYKRP